MKSHLGGMTSRLNDGSWFPTPGDTRDELEFYLDFDGSTSGTVNLYLTTDPAALQSVYNDISSGANLNDKIAGTTRQDSIDWSTAFVGIGAAGTNPEALFATGSTRSTHRPWPGPWNDRILRCARPRSS